MNRIFISYRRQESLGIAGRIFDRLIGRFGDHAVFMDIEGIPAGVDFRDHITTTMGAAKVVLALIGPKWLHMEGPNGRRLDDPDDFVRIELEMAFNRGVPVIPVLLGHTPMPKSVELPESISRLGYFNPTRVNAGADFNQHTARLIKELDARLNPGGVRPESVLPGENLPDMLTRYFRQCDAIITISPEHTLIAEPRTELVGFRHLMDLFRSIEMTDGKKRPLIWILDLGSQKFDDPDARMRFLNLQALLARFKALKLFEEEGSDERWDWLLSRAIIAIFDTRGNFQNIALERRPSFAANHLSLTSSDSGWLSSPTFRELYGIHLEKLRERVFTVFYSATANWSPPSEWSLENLRYFGYASFPVDTKKAIFTQRALELPPLPTTYVEAFRGMCVAAAHKLGIECPDCAHPALKPVDAALQLSYLGYLVLSLQEFILRY